jgi:hypothetical protein
VILYRKNLSEGEAQSECRPIKVQIFDKLSLAKIVVQVLISHPHGKPVADGAEAGRPCHARLVKTSPDTSERMENLLLPCLFRN